MSEIQNSNRRNIKRGTRIRNGRINKKTRKHSQLRRGGMLPSPNPAAKSIRRRRPITPLTEEMFATVAVTAQSRRDLPVALFRRLIRSLTYSDTMADTLFNVLRMGLKGEEYPVYSNHAMSGKPIIWLGGDFGECKLCLTELYEKMARFIPGAVTFEFIETDYFYPYSDVKKVKETRKVYYFYSRRDVVNRELSASEYSDVCNMSQADVVRLANSLLVM